MFMLCVCVLCACRCVSTNMQLGNALWAYLISAPHRQKLFIWKARGKYCSYNWKVNIGSQSIAQMLVSIYGVPSRVPTSNLLSLYAQWAYLISAPHRQNYLDKLDKFISGISCMQISSDIPIFLLLTEFSSFLGLFLPFILLSFTVA